MDEDMEDFVEEFFEDSEFDLDYEFDAGRFFDFSRPESHSEAEEAESWFESVGSYAPSPLLIKLDLRKIIPVENESAFSKSKAGEELDFSSKTSDSDMGNEPSIVRENNKVHASGVPSHNDMTQYPPKAKTKSVSKLFKLRSSTLMKPTASHLAKLNGTQGTSSRQCVGRFQKSVTIDRSSQNLQGAESEATKRQKLECGFLRKVAHLKHHALLLHKLPRKVEPIEANSVHRRLKGTTTPREPDLETAQRAQRQGSRNRYKSGEHPKSDVHTFKARPLNRKILEAPSLPLHKRRVPQLPEFQVFNLKTSERAMQHSSTKALNETSSKRVNTEDALKQEKCEIFHKASSLKKKDLKLPLDERLQNPPIELFTKLSLKSELKSNTPQPKPCMSIKGLKENVPGSFQKKIWRYGINHNQCGSDLKTPEIGPLSNVNRSMDIH